MTTAPVEEQERWCPVAAATRMLASVWAIVVIYYLMDGPKGFNELLRAIPGVNSKTLSRTLKHLQAKGIVVREVVSLQPFSVRYRLTEMGQDLMPVLEALREWGMRWMGPDAAPDGTVPSRAGAKSCEGTPITGKDEGAERGGSAWGSGTKRSSRRSS
ncbi:MAG: helix-turn-helix domain-containing protein [Nitrososphaerota archaeon]|nr:helix-turn-helix transcriptional regulator [Candidatus Calditenuis fumarioli]